MAAHKKPYYAMDAQAYISQVCNGGHRCELTVASFPLLSRPSPTGRRSSTALAALPAAADAQQEGAAGAKEGCSCVLA